MNKLFYGVVVMAFLLANPLALAFDTKVHVSKDDADYKEFKKAWSVLSPKKVMTICCRTL